MADCLSHPDLTLLGFAPLAVEHWGLMLVLLGATGGGVWFFMNRRLQELKQTQAMEAEKLAVTHATEVQQLRAQAGTAAAEAERRREEVEKALQSLREAHEALRAGAERREREAAARIEGLTQDLATNRERAAMLEPTQAALGAEQGRVKALEKTIEVATKRAEDLERRLEAAMRDLGELGQTADLRQRELEAEVLGLRQTMQANETLVSTAEAQISQATEALNAYKQQAEGRITHLQRQLAAAEAKAAMLQKEFMSAVGVLPEKPGAVMAAGGGPEDRRVAELEARLNQVEAEARKKAREDGYKIAELEFRLGEAREALARQG